ncbi:MAG: TRAP transporter fused permease subunit [Deltaproteobacteria bacterium]|nr:TRAP transporter fused permease subunit [Deltaproteobacteria bacterium]
MRSKVADVLDKWFFVLGSIFSLYILSTVIYLFQDPSEHYTSFFLGTSVLISVLTIRNLLRSKHQDFHFWLRLGFLGLACLGCIVASAYLRYNAIWLTEVQPFFESPQIIIGWVMLVSLLILNWYHWGGILTCMIILAIAYVFWGNLTGVPLLSHAEFSSAFCMSYMGLDTVSGVFWFVPMASDKIYFLIIFAALLIGIGMLPLVIELGKWMGRHVKGGAAFPAIVGSAMTGAVMGQAVSNTMLTGQLTIPMMKKHGYSANFAGAIEAVASTSGQFLPPILGLAAFIIAAFLNTAYIDVAMDATLPALLFVGGVIIAILLKARSMNLGYLTEPVDTKLIFQLLPTFAGSFLTVLVLLLLYFSPNVAALSGIGVLIVLCWFQGGRRPKLKTFRDGFQGGLEVVVVLCLLLLAIGPIAQMATITNLAGKLTALLTGLVPHNLLLILIGTMVISIILGMGLPTPVAYLVVALTIAPFLVELGVPEIHAHMFCFYFAVYSTISPPVAISCLAAAKLSGGSFLGTALESMRIAIPTFLIPYLFIYQKTLLVFPDISWLTVWDFFMALLCMFFMSLGLFGFLVRRFHPVERLVAYGICFLGMWYQISDELPLGGLFLAAGAALIIWLQATRKWQCFAKTAKSLA